MATITDPGTFDPHDKTGSKIVKYRLYTGPTSYTTGGDPIAASDVGLGTIDLVIPAGMAYDGVGISSRILHWRGAAGTMVWFVPNTNAEVANGTDLSAFIVRIMAIGH